MREPSASQEEIPMTNQEIMDLVSCFDQSTAQTMKVTREGFTLVEWGGAEIS